MLRTLALTGIAVAFAAGAGTPASADALVRPCHGTGYNYGAVVTNPTTGQEYRFCIEQVGRAEAVPEPIVEPCHGSTYRYGALIWVPGEDRPMRACIEQ